MTTRGRSAPTEGEQWASAQLAALRSSRYDAATWESFLGESFRRAAEIRRQRSALSAQAVRWTLGGGLATAALRQTIVRGGRAPSARGLASWWMTQALMLDWHLGMVQELDGAPREKLSVADALTLSRVAVVPFAACAPPDAVLFLALLGFAGATDLLDGRFARRRGPTRFGRDFDTLADLAFRAAAVRGARRAGWLAGREERSCGPAVAQRRHGQTRDQRWGIPSRQSRPVRRRALSVTEPRPRGAGDE